MRIIIMSRAWTLHVKLWNQSLESQSIIWIYDHGGMSKDFIPIGNIDFYVVERKLTPL